MSPADAACRVIAYVAGEALRALEGGETARAAVLLGYAARVWYRMQCWPAEPDAALLARARERLSACEVSGCFRAQLPVS